MRSNIQRRLPLFIIALLLMGAGGILRAQSSRNLTPDTPLTGTLDNSANIVQIYTLIGGSGEVITLTASNTLGVPLALVLTDAAGGAVGQIVDTDVTGDVTLTATLPSPGVYYVTVFKAGGIGSIGAVDFTILLATASGTVTQVAPAATVTPTLDAALTSLTATTAPVIPTAAAVTPAPEVTLGAVLEAAQLVDSLGITISLTWNTTNDLDLEVRDPVGGSLYWLTPTVASGGSLGANVNQGCDVTTANNPTETAAWLPGAVPSGSYEVLVYFQEACAGAAPQSFTINLNVNGTVLPPVTGTLLPGQTYVSSFDIETDSTVAATGLVGVVDDQILPAPAAEILASAGSIELGTTINGTITNDQPYQAYSFAANASDIVSINMDAISGGSLDTFLALLDPGGAIVSVNDDSAQGITNSAIASALLPSEGTYTIVATRYAKAIGGTEGNFTLTLFSQTAGLPPAFLSLPRGSLEVRLLWNTAADLQLLLRDAAGEAVYDDSPQSRSGGILGADGNVNCRAPVDETAFSYIYYPQTIQPRLGSYEVEVWYQNACNETRPTTFTLYVGLNGREIFSTTVQPLPNERFLTSFSIGANGAATPSDAGIIRGLQTLDFPPEIEGASVIVPGVAANGSITPDNKFDVYVFDGTAGDVVSVAMNATSGTLDTALYLAGSTGAQLAENDDVEPGTNKNSLIANYTLPQTGRYIIIATHFGALYGGTIGTYTLTLTQTQAPAEG
ncbi:MAG: PPC domain-containing protein [Chloroflexota bacterium]|nr:PPC domain-containing protein [Chloroflexota bacterium]